MHTELLDLSTNNETSFFRDTSPFIVLQNELIPKVKEKNAHKKTINIWSAASSMGQEPYSIIMTLMDECELTGWTFRVDATDISEQALKRTREGIYSQLEVQRGLPVKKLIKHFNKLDDGNYQVKPHMKQPLSVQKMNLFEPFSRPYPYDIIFLRNVLIYQNVENKKKILDKIYNVLEPGGFLMLGNGESMIGIDNGFERIQLDKSTVFQKPALVNVKKAA